MRQLTVLFLLFLASQNVFAQGTEITGTVADSLTGKPLNKASISWSSSSTPGQVTQTDSTGVFRLPNIPAGRWSLEISVIGYHTKALPVTASADQPLLSLGTITLTPTEKELQNITVTAQKALVEDKGDRLVYNAAADISNAGGTASDVLRKVPTLTVDLNGNVQMRGNGNIKVLVNGKPSAMMTRNLADALRQMPASIIKSIEVITSPGAKYDAEGAAGIINIITKKGVKGMNGSVNATIGNRNRNLGTNLSVKTGKIALNFSGNGYQYRNTYEASSNRTSYSGGQPVNVLDRSTSADNTGTGGYGDLAFDYDPDSTNHLNFSANVWGGNFPNNAVTSLILTNPSGQVLQNFRNVSQFHNPYGNGQLNLGWTKTLKKPEQEFSLLSQYSRMPDNYFYTTDRITPDEVIIFREKSTNYSRNKEYTFQADYVHPFRITTTKDTSVLKLEVGTKAILRNIGSEVRVEQSLNGKDDLIEDSSQANDFTYTQRVYSGYTSLRWSNKAKWNINAGARLEHTEINGSFLTTGTSLHNHYSNLIPSFLLSKGIKASTFKIAYTQRITRPLIWYLNPWINRSDPKNLTTGTPTLNPEINHATELSHSLSTAGGTTLNTSFYWRMTDNAIEYVSRVDTAGVSINQPRNIARRSVLGLNINLSAKPNKNWNLNASTDVRHMDVSSPAMLQHNSGFVWNVNLNTTYKLPKDNSIQVFAGVNSGWLTLQRSATSAWYWYGLSAKHLLKKDKGSITLNMNNPFTRGIRQENIEEAPSFYTRNSSLYVNQSFRLTFEWRFGQLSAEGGKKGKKITNDDSGR